MRDNRRVKLPTWGVNREVTTGILMELILAFKLLEDVAHHLQNCSQTRRVKIELKEEEECLNDWFSSDTLGTGYYRDTPAH